MSLGFEFHPDARAEFVSDVDWYDDRENGLGADFGAAVRAAVDAAVEDPGAWARWPAWDREPVVRSKGVGGFPYRVVYFVDGDVVRIVAVAQAKRRPGYWRERLPSV